MTGDRARPMRRAFGTIALAFGIAVLPVFGYLIARQNPPAPYVIAQPAQAPAWMAKYVRAMCVWDGDYLGRHSGDSMMRSLVAFHAQQPETTCTGVRYLGAARGGIFQVYAIANDEQPENWYVFTVDSENEQVEAVE